MGCVELVQTKSSHDPPRKCTQHCPASQCWSVLHSPLNHPDSPEPPSAPLNNWKSRSPTSQASSAATGDMARTTAARTVPTRDKDMQRHLHALSHSVGHPNARERAAVVSSHDTGVCAPATPSTPLPPARPPTRPNARLPPPRARGHAPPALRSEQSATARAHRRWGRPPSAARRVGAGREARRGGRASRPRAQSVR